MAIIQKTLFPENLEKYNTFVRDTETNSKYFKITELPDTLTGGKNAFLIQGSQYLVPDTLIKIEIKDSQGNIIYHEPGEGIVSASVGGESIVTEYYEGVSKVVSVYVYPDTTFGPATITILGEVSSYDNNGLLTPIPLDWEGKYNVKWQRQVNINPALANTTKIRFYKRPTASISEILSPIYKIENDLKVASAVTQSFANIKLSNLETFAGDVKRVKVFRTSTGDISDYDLIQDILVESKELLTSYGLSGSVVGNTGIFTSEVLKNQWNSGSLTAILDSSRVESGVRLTGNGNFTYTQSLDLKSTNTYELSLDAFYSASTDSNLGVYLNYTSQSTTFSSSITTLVGTQPTKNLSGSIIPFKIDRDYPTASLYFSQSQGEWHVGNVSLKLSQDTAFSPDEIGFITTMPTVLGNETFNFRFEFYDINNNYVPVEVTQSAIFTGGNTNIGGTILLISSSASGLSSSFSSSLTAVSTSISGTILINSSSVSTSVGLLTGSITTLSGSVNTISSSVSQSIALTLSSSLSKVQLLADGGLSGSFISGSIIGEKFIFSPVIGGVDGYFSGKFQVGAAPNPIVLDAQTSTRKIYIGTGTYGNSNTSVYLDSTGKFSLGNKLSYDGSNLSVNGSITITNPSTANNGGAVGSFSNGDALTGGSIAGVTIASTKIYIGTGTFANSNTAFYVDNTGQFSLKDKLYWDGTTLNIVGNLNVGSSVPNSVVTGLGGLATKNSVGSGEIDADSVTEGKIGANAVTNAKIAADAVTEGKLAANAVTEGKISANAVVAGKIAADAVTADKIAAGSITAGKIVAGAITADKIDASAITADKIATNAITADKILAGAVTAAKVDVAGVITAGSIVVAGNNISTLTNNSGYQANGDAKTGGSVGGWSITSTEIQGGSPAGGGDGSFTSQGVRLGAGGYISSKNFYIDTSGNASFKGNITATGGSFTGDVTAGSATLNSFGITFGSLRLTSSGVDFVGSGYGSLVYDYSMFTQRMRLYQNTTSQGGQDNSLQFDFLYSASGLTTLGVDSSGYVKKVSSSKKYKKEINPLPLESAKRILDLNIVSFKDKDAQVSDTLHSGLIAEEVADLNYKDWVIYDNSGSVDGVYYQSIFASMVKVVQDLNKRVEELEAKLSGSI